MTAVAFWIAADEQLDAEQTDPSQLLTVRAREREKTRRWGGWADE